MIPDEELIDAGVPAINRRVDIWRLDEEAEASWIRSGLVVVVPYIPQAVRPILLDAADGLDDAEVQKHSSKTLDDAVAAATEHLPSWVQSVVAPVIRTQLAPFVNALFEFAQQGFALGLEKNTI